MIPGVIRPVRDARGKVKVRVTVPTQNGWKAIALSAGARQELFISTDLTTGGGGGGAGEGGALGECRSNCTFTSVSSAAQCAEGRCPILSFAAFLNLAAWRADVRRHDQDEFVG